jgi:4-hydroxy-3-methylbut-2-enyl diphosphate reductase
MKESPVKKTTYHRKGFGLKDQIELELKNVYESELIAALRNSGNVLTRNGVTVRLAQAFGFCWGVDRAVSMAYETRRHFPERKIWITNEIIHNPLVNKHLREMDIQFIETDALGQKNLNLIGEGDVVILPAFGASVKEMALIEDRRCEIVDTTCPWVSRVWGRVMKYEQGDFTAVIHGKPNHEETVATSSRAKNYLIVRNLDEAQWVSDYILKGGRKDDFQARFSSAISPGFDPEEHLMRIGVANQTTMLKGETEQIGRLFQDTMLKKYGPTKLDEHFLSPGDTICDATQERQDAMLDLVGEKLDLILVIGGFNSSNTGHLQEIAEHKGLRSYHIDGPDCLGPGNRIKYKPLTVNPRQTLDVDGLMAQENFLPAGELVVGVTAGASTPDQVVAEVLERLFNLPR